MYSIFKKKFELIKKNYETNYQYFFCFKIRCKYKLNEIKNKIKIVKYFVIEPFNCNQLFILSFILAE